MWKISEFFLSEIFQFLELKFSIYLNRRVSVMLPANILLFVTISIWCSRRPSSVVRSLDFFRHISRKPMMKSSIYTHEPKRLQKYLHMCAQWRFRSPCSFVHSSILTKIFTGHILIVKDAEFLHADNKDFDQAAQMTDKQADLSRHWARVSDGTFSLVVAHILLIHPFSQCIWF